MFKKIFTFMIIAILATMISFCGKKEEPKEEMKEEAKTVAADSGIASKLKAYEDFVTKFCALSEKMKTASVTEKVALGKEFKADSDNLKTLQTDINEAKNATPDQTAKVKAATAKAAGCAATAMGASPSAVPATPELPKAPKIPGM